LTDQDSSNPPSGDNATRSEISGSARDVVQARDVSGGVHFHYGDNGTVPTPIPRQLPAVIRDFAGRADDLLALDALLQEDDAENGQIGSEQPGAVVITAINGMAGIGKTTLAVYWAYRQRNLARNYHQT
jgi:hypothetical protein